MEGRGRSRRHSPQREWKRRLSSVLAVVLTVVMVLNMPLSIDGLGLRISNAFASGNGTGQDSVWATASNAKYKQGDSKDVDIYVIAEDNGVVPGNTSSMTLYLKNNTDQEITEGVLTFKGKYINKEDVTFQDIGAGEIFDTVIAGGGPGTPSQDTAESAEDSAADAAAFPEASGEGLLYQEVQGTEADGNDAALMDDGNDAALIDDDNDVEPAGDDFDAENGDVEENDEDEEEPWKLEEIDLQPGELHEIHFEFYTEEDIKSTKANVTFSFRGENEEGSRVESSTKFYYSIGLPTVNFSMEDGMQIESGVSNDLEIWMSEPDWVDEDLEEKLLEQEEKKEEEEMKDDEEDAADGTESGIEAGTASDSEASKDASKASNSNASKNETASDSNADKDNSNTVSQEDEEKIDKYTQEAMEISESRVNYTVEIFGAKVDLHARKTVEAEDIGWISCVYEVDTNTEPGIYYGKITASGKWNKKDFTSEQGFLFEVTGEWTGNYTAESENVTVHAHAEDGVLPKNVTLKVTELPKGSTEYLDAQGFIDEADTQYDDMMALDIRFEDQNGNEVEPKGEVQVAIAMKEGVLPEDVALETIEVHHLKELDEETIEVEAVADGADKTNGTVKTGEEAAAGLSIVENIEANIIPEVVQDTVAVAEFSVESFSRFTITWNYSYEVTVKFGNVRGTGENQTFYEWEFSNAPSGVIDLTGEFNWSNYAKSFYNDKNENRYSYSKTRLVDESGIVLGEYNNSTREIFKSEADSENSDQYRLFYMKNREWIEVPNGSTIQLFYELNGRHSLGIVDTEDTSDTININLYDYASGTRIGSGADSENNIVKGGFKFADDDHNKPTNWTANSGVIQNLVLKTLSENNGQKYPRLNDDGKTFLSPLFSTGNGGKASRVISEANHLFQEDEDGYLYYDSSENFATIGDDGNFTVYSTPRNIQNVGADYAKFLPFNDLQVDTDSNGHLLTEDANYHFGMTVDFTFLMPKEGKVNGNDMVFEFSGDDDVWVFIDDVLVLDMGGIHDSYDGSINFATGDVWISGVSGEVSKKNGKYVYTNKGPKTENISERFRAAGSNLSWDPTPYKTHTLKFYYFERGAGGSNCKIRFNMPRVPEGTINFGKSINYSNVADSANFDFYFKAYINKVGNKNLPLNNYEVYKGLYDIYSVDGNDLIRDNVSTGEDGLITLKDGQYAQIKGTEENGITETSMFYVVETGVSSDQYTVKIGNLQTLAKPFNGDEQSGGANNAFCSDPYVVGDLEYVAFINDVVADNAFNLKIQKEMVNAPDNAGPFYAQLYLGEGTGQLYTGTYDLYEEGVCISSNIKIDSKTGLIQLDPGQYALITGLVGGNTIRVVETDNTGKQFTGNDTYINPTYSISGSKNKEGISIVDPETESSPDPITAVVKAGKELGEDPIVTATITNALKPSVTIRKEVRSSMGEIAKDFKFTISVKNDAGTDVTSQFVNKDYSGIRIDEEGCFELSNGEAITIKNLPYNGTITVTEDSDSSNGYTTKIWVNGVQISPGVDDVKSTEQNLSGTMEILFINSRELTPPTGILNDNYPFILMIAIAAVGTTSFIYPSCRRRKQRSSK